MALEDVVVFTIPFVPTISSGSGVERYAYELLNNFPDEFLNYRIISNIKGNKFKRVLIGGAKFLNGAILKNSKLFHAVSPISAHLLFESRRHHILTTVHDVIYLDWSHGWPPLEPLRKKYNILSILKSDHIIVPFQYTKKRIMEEFDIDYAKISVVGYGIDLARYHTFYKTLGNKTQKKYDVIFLGGVNPMSRGGEQVINIYRKILKVNPSTKVAIAGKGGQMEKLKKLSNALGIFEMINWIDFIPEEKMPEVIGSSSLLLYPSYMGFSYLLMQSMAVGVPAVSSNLFDIPEFLGNAGITCPINDIERFSDTILSLVNDRDLLGAYVTKGINIVKKMTPMKMAMETVNVYEQILR
jgi:glycosyltransferase involved in cell wall biosynthesis